MQIFMTAAGITLLLLIVVAAHEHGRKTEEQCRRTAEEYAAKCVRDYHTYNQGLYLATESYRRWVSSLPEPQMYQFSSAPQHQRRAVTNGEFAERYQKNGQATMMIQNGRSN